MPTSDGRFRGISVPNTPWKVEVEMEDGSWVPGVLLRTETYQIPEMRRFYGEPRALIQWGQPTITTWFLPGEWRRP